MMRRAIIEYPYNQGYFGMVSERAGVRVYRPVTYRSV